MSAPLDGIRILDFTQGWAGPHASRLLADYGAEVINVEYIKRLDMMRGALLDNQAYNNHARVWHLNRNKHSITLDLHRPLDRSIFSDLLEIADVFLENSRPGVVARLGFCYEQVKMINPSIVMVSMSAFGQTGPEAAHAGYGGSIEAISGIQSLTAYDANCMPNRIKELDVTNGIMGAAAVLTGLIHRQVTGQGQWIDLSQAEAASHCLIGEHLLAHATNAEVNLPIGNRNPNCAPQGCYRCKGEDRWLAITIDTENQWQSLCLAIDHPEWLTDPRFTTSEARQLHHDILDSLIEAWTIQQDHKVAMHYLQSNGIPAGAVLDLLELCQDPHLSAREYFQHFRDGDNDPAYPGFPIRLSKGGGSLRHKGPQLGEYNRIIIHDLLGRTDSSVPTIKSDEIGTFYDS
jgi:crotonobetainyl-CoA:carnitine CoA-transferase CaiB-like acyl-CoA transferase